jgi:uncharacterized membrane protein
VQHILELAAGTVALRPYVFAFFAAYLAVAVPHLGWRKISFFTVAGYLIAFSSEYVSINYGFPYGWYYYIDRTSSRELWVAGVPFFDSLSYVFLAYCSYATALLILSPVRTSRFDVVTLETKRIRRSFSVLLLGSLLQMFLDIVIDPVALQGSRWFLGQIYGYRDAGIHFGVPLSNYLGWWLVSALMIAALQAIDSRCECGRDKPVGVAAIPFRALLGPVLYLSVVSFNLSVTLWIGERLMALSGLFVMSLPLAITVVTVMSKANAYRREDLALHFADYPYLVTEGRVLGRNRTSGRAADGLAAGKGGAES